MCVNKILKSGVFNGNEYVGHVTEQDERFVGNVHQVPEANDVGVFLDGTREDFDTCEEAEEFVFREWERRFGK